MFGHPPKLWDFTKFHKKFQYTWSGGPNNPRDREKKAPFFMFYMEKIYKIKF